MENSNPHICNYDGDGGPCVVCGLTVTDHLMEASREDETPWQPGREIYRPTSEYSLEFCRWNRDMPERWALYKKNYLYTQEEWDSMEKHPLMEREGHPWNLGEGEVVPDHLVSMNTKKFLKLMVDALNEKESKPEVPYDEISDLCERIKTSSSFEGAQLATKINLMLMKEVINTEL